MFFVLLILYLVVGTFFILNYYGWFFDYIEFDYIELILGLILGYIELSYIELILKQNILTNENAKTVENLLQKKYFKNLMLWYNIENFSNISNNT